MLVNLYKSKTPIAVFSFPLLIGLLALPIFLLPQVLSAYFFSWQSSLVTAVISTPVIHYITVVILLYITSIEVNRLVNSYGFYSKNTYLPGLVFALGLFSFNQVRFSMLLLAIGFLVYGLGFLFRINRQDPAVSSIFLSSLFFGFATVFEPLLAPIIVLPWFALVVFRSFIWREWFILFIGLGVPWLYHFGIYFSVTGQVNIPNEGFSLNSLELSMTLPKMCLYGFLGLVLIFSIWRFLILLNSQLLVFKKRSRLLFHLSWLTLLSLVLGWMFYGYFISVAWIPFAIIIALQMLNANQNLYANFILFCWIGLSVWTFIH